MKHPTTHRRAMSRRTRRRGLSLLEVVLALAILAMSVALLSQATRQAADNGMIAQRLSTAHILCESKMAEVVAGAIPLQSGSWVAITERVPSGQWYYRIQTSNSERKNMIGIRLGVTDQPDVTAGSPELFYIVRWMIDPNLGLDKPPQQQSGSGTSGTSGSSGPTGSGGIQ